MEKINLSNGLKIGLLFSLTLFIFSYPIALSRFANWASFPETQLNSFSEEVLAKTWDPFLSPNAPLTQTLFKIELFFFGPQPFWFHLINFSFHLLTLLFVMLVFRKLELSNIAFAMVALCFALHPLQVETIFLGAEKGVLWGGFFYWTSFWGFLCFAKSSEKERKYYWLSLLAFGLAILSEEMALTLPLLLLAWGFCFQNETLKKQMTRLIPWFLFALCTSFYYLFHLFTSENGSKVFECEGIKCLKESSESFFFSVYQFFWPLNLACYYPKNPLISSEHWLQWIFVFGTLLFFLLLLFLISKKGTTQVRFLFVSLAIVLLPGTVLAYTPDRNAYFFIPFLAALIGSLCNWLWNIRSKAGKFILAILFLASLFGMFFLTFMQAMTWRNPLGLWQQTLRVNPKNAYVFYNYGRARYYRRQYDFAILDFEKAIRLAPTYAPAYNNRGVAKIRLQYFRGAEKDFTKAIQLSPKNPDYYNNRGRSRILQQKFEGALEDYQEAIRLNSNYVIGYYNLAEAKRWKENYQEAIKDYSKAIALNSKIPQFFLGRGRSKEANGDTTGAIEDYSQSVRIYSDFVDGYRYRGKLLFAQKKYSEAHQDYLEIKRINTQQR